MKMKELYTAFKSSNGISTDTRTLQEGELFIALSGENFDGNKFVPAAFAKGASHVVCTDEQMQQYGKVTIVDDVLKTLQDLATYHRQQLNIPILGLTGSNGKTTTKELILSVLSQKFKAKGTKGNLNNHIGVPLTLLSFDEETEIGVVEMGANHLREIAALSAIAQPSYGLITNFGKAHLEGFGSIEGVKKGKSELYDFLNSTSGKAIVLATDEEQMSRTVDLNRRLTPHLLLKSSQPIEFELEDHIITTQLTGSYNFNNMALAAAVGLEFGLSVKEISKGLISYKPENNRSQLIERGKATIIMDAYNANPTSMKAALESLSEIEGTTIAILGDMFEMGTYAAAEHQHIADLAEKLNIHQVYLIGENFRKTIVKKSKLYADYEAFKLDLPVNSGTKATILIKGSRGMALERVLDLM
jgi:UDP-N-acetylmuramoyl-tripeptide--D-alanyl-D-alanine ligase